MSLRFPILKQTVAIQEFRHHKILFLRDEKLPWEFCKGEEQPGMLNFTVSQSLVLCEGRSDCEFYNIVVITWFYLGPTCVNWGLAVNKNWTSHFIMNLRLWRHKQPLFDVSPLLDILHCYAINQNFGSRKASGFDIWQRWAGLVGQHI